MFTKHSESKIEKGKNDYWKNRALDLSYLQTIAEVKTKKKTKNV